MVVLDLRGRAPVGRQVPGAPFTDGWLATWLGSDAVLGCADHFEAFAVGAVPVARGRAQPVVDNANPTAPWPIGQRLGPLAWFRALDTSPDGAFLVIRAAWADHGSAACRLLTRWASRFRRPAWLHQRLQNAANRCVQHGAGLFAYDRRGRLCWKLPVRSGHTAGAVFLPDGRICWSDGRELRVGDPRSPGRPGRHGAARRPPGALDCLVDPPPCDPRPLLGRSHGLGFQGGGKAVYADVEGDGTPECIMPCSALSWPGWLKAVAPYFVVAGLSGGGWRERLTIPVPTDPEMAALPGIVEADDVLGVGDVNRDGQPELILRFKRPGASWTYWQAYAWRVSGDRLVPVTANGHMAGDGRYGEVCLVEVDDRCPGPEVVIADGRRADDYFATHRVVWSIHVHGWRDGAYRPLGTYRPRADHDDGDDAIEAFAAGTDYRQVSSSASQP